MMTSDHEFGMSVEVDNATGEILAVYFQIRRGKSAESREFGKGRAIADYNADGELIGVEFLGPCDVTVLDRISEGDTAANRFMRQSAPREMVVA